MHNYQFYQEFYFHRQVLNSQPHSEPATHLYTDKINHILTKPQYVIFTAHSALAKQDNIAYRGI